MFNRRTKDRLESCEQQLKWRHSEIGELFKEVSKINLRLDALIDHFGLKTEYIPPATRFTKKDGR